MVGSEGHLAISRDSFGCHNRQPVVTVWGCCYTFYKSEVCVCICVWEGASLVAQTVKNLPAMQETRVPSLSWEDPLEKRMATHSSMFAWRIPST